MRIGLSRREFLPLAGGAVWSAARAEPNPMGLAGDALSREGRYLPLYQLARAGGKGLPIGQWAALVGDEGLALAGTRPKGPLADPPDLEAAICRPAIETIVEAAKGQRVVMLNEAHDASRHRAFLTALLPALRHAGFTHLACETFLNTTDPGAPDIRRFGPGQVFDPHCGYYTWDPVFADAVRQAAALGYQLAPYEQRLDQWDPKLRGAESIAQRETAEADNFARLLAEAPDGRFLVYVGYSHLRKAPDSSGDRWFALRLKEKTGIEPLSVAQAFVGSFGPHGGDGPDAQAVLARFSPQGPVTVRLKDGTYLGAKREAADLAVIHPALPDVGRRPGWLARAPDRRRVRVRSIPTRAEGPRLLQAIHEIEPGYAVPADQVLLAPGAEAEDLWLRPGGYRIRLETLAGHFAVGRLIVRG